MQKIPMMTCKEFLNRIKSDIQLVSELPLEQRDHWLAKIIERIDTYTQLNWE